MPRLVLETFGTIDPKADAAYIMVGSGSAVDKTVEVAPGVNIDYAANGTIIGFEILGASTLLRQDSITTRGPV